MENQRLFLYLAMGFVLVLMWTAWQQDYNQPVSVQAPTVSSEPPLAPPIAANESTASGTARVAPPSMQSAAGSIVRVVTDLLEVEINTLGGEIRSARLRNYHVSSEDPSPFPLLSRGDDNVFVAQSGLYSQTAPAPDTQALFTAPAAEYRLADGENELVVPLTWTSETGVQVVKRYVFHRDRYVIDLQQEIDNQSGQAWKGHQYAQLRQVPPEEQRSIFFAHTYSGGVLHSPNERYEKISFEDMAAGRLKQTIEAGWLAMIQHYFLAAWIPPADTKYLYYTQAQGNEVIFGMSSPERIAEPGARTTFASRLYMGPKEQDRLAGVAPDLELTVDYGKLTVIAQPLFWLLQKIHSFVGNWGFSIILLTLLIKVAFYKLSEASYRSMARMRTLQPKMQQLKERFGDDRQRMNQELMELYKREKINPLGGCLPVVVQIPVFIALYWVLLESVELRQADFILWIHDLSAPDPYFVLPILMGISMFVQQRLNPAPMDPVQARVMMFLPLVFTVFFLFFPAGLVVYWVTNNVLSIAQQWLITKRIERGDKKA